MKRGDGISAPGFGGAGDRGGRPFSARSEELLNPLVMKLESFMTLSKTERDAIGHLRANVRRVAPGRPIIQEGDTPRDAYLILKGIACQYRTLEHGSRQIIDFLVPGDLSIPGDLCSGNPCLLRRMDYGIGTLSDCDIAHLDSKSLAVLTAQYPHILQGFCQTRLMKDSILREAIANVGRRSADKRVAHILCELFLRLRDVGYGSPNELELPLTQIDIADATALSVVHTNRIFRKMHEKNLVSLGRRSIRITDAKRLMEAAEFDVAYLHPHADDEKILCGLQTINLR